MPDAAKKTRSIGPTSRLAILAKLDGRRREARYLRQVEADLLAQIGGAERATVAQRILIHRTAVDLLRLELLDATMAAGRLSEHDGRVAHALRNSVRLALRDLGLRPAAERPPTVTEIMAALRGPPAEEPEPEESHGGAQA